MVLVCKTVQEGDQVLFYLHRLAVEEALEDAATLLTDGALYLKQVKVDE